MPSQGTIKLNPNVNANSKQVACMQLFVAHRSTDVGGKVGDSYI